MAKKLFSVMRQTGFKLNPEDKVVNSIIRGLDRCKGMCPCYNPKDGEEIPEEDLMCPCKEYRENKHCRCNLYVEDAVDQVNNDLDKENKKLRRENKELSKEIALLEMEVNELKKEVKTQPVTRTIKKTIVY